MRAAGAAGIVIAMVMGLGATASANLTTRPKVYRAFTPHGNSVFRTRLRHGSCFVGASSINRRDAWRCTGGHLIYDPCFSSSKRPGIVLCPNDPWSGTGVKLRLTARLRGGNGPAPSTRARPWAVELYDGRRCQVITGASSILQGQRANFDCGRKQDALWGNPDRSTAPWTIFTAPFDAQALLARAAIRYAWM